MPLVTDRREFIVTSFRGTETRVHTGAMLARLDATRRVKDKEAAVRIVNALTGERFRWWPEVDLNRRGSPTARA